MTYKYGIDFGTTNSSIALHFKGTDEEQHTYVVEVRRNKRPYESIPSVFFIENGKIWAGEDAKTKRDTIPAKKINEDQYKKRVKIDLENTSQNLQYNVGGYIVKGVDLIATLFRQLKEKADISVQEQELKMDGVVLGVPVAYDQIAKNVLTEALFKAGFYKNLAEAKEKTEFVSEPTAVAIHYGLDLKKDATVLVFDFGGGTLDLALVNLKQNIGGNIIHPHETLSTARRTIGGEDFDRMFFINSFCKPNKYGTETLCKAFGFPSYYTPEKLWDELLKNTAGIRFIENVVEECKKGLSERSSYKCSFIDKDIQLDTKTFYRDDFIDAIQDSLSLIEDVIYECLEKADIVDPYEVDGVYMAGGSSLIPAVQERLEDIFGRQHVNIKVDSVDKYVDSYVSRNRIRGSEVLTSIVRGLARVGYKETANEEIIRHRVECDFGVWDDIRNCFLTIIERGTLIEETKFDKLSQEGIFRTVICPDADVSNVEVKVYQRQHEGKEKNHMLGKINIQHPGGKKYRIYMTIDEDNGMLEVVFYDVVKNRWIEDIPLNERRYDI